MWYFGDSYSQLLEQPPAETAVLPRPLYPSKKSTTFFAELPLFCFFLVMM